MRYPALLLATAISFVITSSSWAIPNGSGVSSKKFKDLERSLEGRLGIFALDTSDGAQLGYRANEFFPVESTFKVFVAGAILDRSMRDPKLMKQRLRVPRELAGWSPITEKHVGKNMTVSQLVDAALRYSDNTATNLLMEMLGGPAAVTDYARSIGDNKFRIDNYEPHLNNEPSNPRDKSTPQAMGLSLQKLALGDALQVRQRKQLQNGLIGNTT